MENWLTYFLGKKLQVTDELWDTEGKQRSLDNVRRTSLANVDKIADSAVDKTANEPDYIVHEETRKDLDLLNTQNLTKILNFLKNL